MTNGAQTDFCFLEHTNVVTATKPTREEICLSNAIIAGGRPESEEEEDRFSI
jgi:hypothetical protein